MPQTQGILDDSRSVTLDTNGKGTVTYGPQRPNITYQVTNIAVEGSLTTTPVAKARVYVGSVMLAGTYDGNQDSTEADVTLYTGQSVSVTFTEGNPGDLYTAHFHGIELRGME